MGKRTRFGNIILLLAFAAVGLIGYAATIQDQIVQARAAVEREGFRVDEVLPATGVCTARRSGFVWRAGGRQGVACVGNFLPPTVRVLR